MPQSRQHSAGMAPLATRQQSLWDFAIALYKQEGVADACLDLQDRHGVNVLLLFFAGWAGAKGRLLSQADIRTAASVMMPWYDGVIMPLRTLRRSLKTGPYPAPDEQTEALRTKIKGDELEAEKIALRLLQDLPSVGDPASPREAVDANILLALRFSSGIAGEPLPDSARMILAAFSAHARKSSTPE